MKFANVMENADTIRLKSLHPHYNIIIKLKREMYEIISE